MTKTKELFDLSMQLAITSGFYCELLKINGDICNSDKIFTHCKKIRQLTTEISKNKGQKLFENNIRQICSEVRNVKIVLLDCQEYPDDKQTLVAFKKQLEEILVLCNALPI